MRFRRTQNTHSSQLGARQPAHSLHRLRARDDDDDALRRPVGDDEDEDAADGASDSESSSSSASSSTPLSSKASEDASGATSSDLLNSFIDVLERERLFSFTAQLT